MDIVNLIDKGKRFESLYAAPSILTGRFVACITNSTISEVKDAFTNPGRILVQNAEGLVVDKEYDDYSGFYSVDDTDKGIIVKLSREESANHE